MDLVLVTILHVLDQGMNDKYHYEIVLEELGGISQLEILSNNLNSVISEKANAILEKINKKDLMKF